MINTNYRSLYEFHMASGYAMTVVVAARQHTIPYGVCELDACGNLKRLQEKPFYDVLVNTGLYVLAPDALGHIPQECYFDMPQLISRLLDTGHSIGVFPVPNNAFMDVGAWSEYNRSMQRLDPQPVTRRTPCES